MPSECWFDWEVRPLPSFDPSEVENELRAFADDELVPRMQTVAADTGIAFETLQSYPGLDTQADGRVAELIAALAGRSDFGTVAFGTEGGLFHRAEIPTVVCGPGFMAQGHKPDEYIAVEQLEACDALMQRLAKRLGESAEP